MANPPRFEAGDYEGEPAIESAHRLRRMEVRQNKFMRSMGFNPVQEQRERADLCLAHDGALYATTQNVTVGQISIAANEARLSGKTQLFVNGNYWGEVDV